MLKISEKNNIVTITLNRPEVRNAFNPQMIEEITEQFRSLTNRSDVKLIVLRGEGKAFCAGGDLNWMREMKNYSLEENDRDSQKLFEMFESIYKCDLPVLAAVHGSVFAGALGIIAASDYVISEETTQFCFSEVRIGLAPAVISAFVLKKTTLGFVAPWMLSAKVFTATEAQRAGLVHDIVTSSDFEKNIEFVSKLFLSGGPESIRLGKKMIRDIPGMSLSEAKSATCKLIAERRVSSEGQEGLTSFLEKRNPSWLK